MAEPTTNTRNSLPVETVYWVNGAIHGLLRQALQALVNYQASVIAVRLNVVPADECCAVTIQVAWPEKIELRRLGQRRHKNNRTYYETWLHQCRVVWMAESVGT